MKKNISFAIAVAATLVSAALIPLKGNAQTAPFQHVEGSVFTGDGPGQGDSGTTTSSDPLNPASLSQSVPIDPSAGTFSGLAAYGLLRLSVSAQPTATSSQSDTTGDAKWADVFTVSGPSNTTGTLEMDFHVTGSLTGRSSASFQTNVVCFGCGTYVPGPGGTLNVDSSISAFAQFTYDQPFVIVAEIGESAGGLFSNAGASGSVNFWDTAIVTGIILPPAATGITTASGTDYSHIVETVPDTGSTFGLLALALAALFGASRFRALRLA